MTQVYLHKGDIEVEICNSLGIEKKTHKKYKMWGFKEVYQAPGTFPSTDKNEFSSQKKEHLSTRRKPGKIRKIRGAEIQSLQEHFITVAWQN